MAAWQKVIPVEETSSEKLYYMARGSSDRGFLYWSRLKNGKQAWSCKPGIAMKFFGGPTLVSDFAKNARLNLVAVEVPSDYEKRFKKR